MSPWFSRWLSAKSLPVAAFAVASFLTTNFGLAISGVQAHAEDTLRLGLSLQPSNALVMVALDRGYFSQEGLKVSTKLYVSGSRALRDGLLKGKIDFATASDVPIVLNSFARQDFRVIATIFRVENLNRIVARADSGIKEPRDLRGKRLATQRGSAVHFFLHLFLLENGIRREEVRQSFMKAGELPKALAGGRIDAFSMREPYVGQARKLLGGNAVVFAAPGLYPQTDQIVVTQRFLKRKPEATKRLLRALVKAEEFVTKNPPASQRIVGKFLGAKPATIRAIWPELIPRLSLSQSLLLRFEIIGRWAIRRKLTNAQWIPNFLDLVHYGALEAVKPDAVTMVY